MICKECGNEIREGNPVKFFDSTHSSICQYCWKYRERKPKKKTLDDWVCMVYGITMTLCFVAMVIAFMLAVFGVIPW